MEQITAICLEKYAQNMTLLSWASWCKHVVLGKTQRRMNDPKIVPSSEKH